MGHPSLYRREHLSFPVNFLIFPSTFPHGKSQAKLAAREELPRNADGGRSSFIHQQIQESSRCPSAMYSTAAIIDIFGVFSASMVCIFHLYFAIFVEIS
jgi:hypothetical protein